MIIGFGMSIQSQGGNEANLSNHYNWKKHFVVFSPTTFPSLIKLNVHVWKKELNYGVKIAMIEWANHQTNGEK